MFRSAAALATLVVLAGCGQEPAVCSAIGWSNGVTVRLADDWPAGDGRMLAVACPAGEGCVETLAGEASATTAPLVGGTAVVRFGFATPDSLTLRVRDASGVLTEHQAEPEWVRVGGSEECSGPSESDEVVVPAP